MKQGRGKKWNGATNAAGVIASDNGATRCIRFTTPVGIATAAFPRLKAFTP